MAIAIDLGSQYIHLAIGKKAGAKVEMTKLLEVECPNVSFDEQGRVKVEEVSKLIKECLTEHGVKDKEVILTLQNEMMVSRELVLPKVKEKELQAMLKQEMSLLLESHVDYLITHDIPQLEEDKVRVHARALPYEIVESCYQLVRGIGGRLKALNTHDYYIKHCVQPLNKKSNFIIADIGSQNMQLYLFEQGKNVFYQNIEINTRQHEMTFASLNEMQGIAQEFKDLELGQGTMKVHTFVEGTVEDYLYTLVNQIEYMIQFQLNRNGREPVESIYICGGVSNMKGIESYLSNELGIPVEQVKVLYGIGESKAEIKSEYLNAINALRCNQHDFDFKDAYKKLKRDEQNLSNVTMIGGMILGAQVVIGLVFSVTNLTQGIMMKGEIGQIKAFIENEATKAKINELKTLQSTKNENETKLRVLEQVENELKAMPLINGTFLETLVAELPQDAEITALSYEEGILNISCECKEEESIIDYVQYIRQISTIEKVLYQGFNNEQGDYVFNLTINLKGGTQLETQS